MRDEDAWAVEWSKKGDSDMQAAEILLASDRGPHDAICFHCQQCVEKYLKGFLAHLGLPIPKTHDLEKLLALIVDHDPSFSRWASECNLLTEYAVSPRYPDDYYEYSRDEADDAISHAVSIRNFVRGKTSFLSTVE